MQSIWEYQVDYNLTESGIHPFTLEELLPKEEIQKLISTRLEYGHTRGLPELREAISSLYPNTGIDNILVTNGSAEANFIAMWSHLEPGDELVMMLPNFMQIWGLTRSFGVEVKPFRLREDLRWGPDLEELKSQITPRTKMITICNPNNPTGAVLSDEEMQAIIQLANENNLYIHADEVYRGAELDGVESRSFWGNYNKAVISEGLSKAYALPGLRIGWLIGPEDFIEKAWSYHDYTSLNAGMLSNKIATLVMQKDLRAKIFKRNRDFLNENLAVLTGWMNSHNGLFEMIPPRAGGIAFLRYNMDINSTELITKLREDKSVFIVPGDCFLMDGYIRIGYGTKTDYLLAALSLFDETLAELT